MLELWHLYLGCLIVGGGLVGISFLTDADHDADMDMDVDVDVDVDADIGLDLDHDLDHDAELASSVSAADALWLPLLSLRFWIFFVFFFGLMGILLHFTSGLGAYAVLGIAVGTGFGCGWIGSTIVSRLRSERVDSNIDPEVDYPGKQGEVLLGVEAHEPGQVRLHVKGVDVDLMAESHAGEAIPVGAQVLVTAYRQGRLVVRPAEVSA